MPPDLNSPSLRFLTAYWNVWQALAARAELQLSQEHGLDLRAFIALSYLQSGVRSPGELALQMGLPRYVVTRTLDALSRLDAVERATDRADGRRQQLGVTAAGRALWQQALQTVEEVCEVPLSSVEGGLTPLTLQLEQLARVAQHPLPTPQEIHP
ncbi:MarR family winged helix-turn-helix transcriptional regulator [Deinococcus sonorensis]|uniref:MarR family winged helix-turn-helix transcriptional regulator n=2 Tax=Deinococcus sonorensis TaxID=309891 RepID=A0AAU7U772_9DEIO